MTLTAPRFIRSLFAFLFVAFFSLPALAADPADAAAGVYSKNGGATKLTVVKTGPNSVSVSSNDGSIPAFTTDVAQTQAKVQQTGGANTLAFDGGKKPNTLQVTANGVSWSGTRHVPDLADTAEGVYFGDVSSDARGSSRSDVTITVKRIGRNLISVSSSYPRLKTFEAKLERAMETIQYTGPNGEVFLLDLSKKPMGLDVTIDEASWMGARR